MVIRTLPEHMQPRFSEGHSWLITPPAGGMQQWGENEDTAFGEWPLYANKKRVNSGWQPLSKSSFLDCVGTHAQSFAVCHGRSE